MTEIDLRRVRAANAGPLTGTGTNTYLLGRGEVVVIDPGPDLPDHMAAILAALDQGERVAAILVTHSHLDHSALARPLSRATGAPMLGAGPAGSGRSATMTRLAAAGLTGGGEGFDLAWHPDRQLHDGARLTLGHVVLDVLATPGHTGCHLAFGWGDNLFAGDTVMGWSTSLVSPPDGDMGAYMATLRRLALLPCATIHPGHGEVISDPAARLTDLLQHRLDREAQILAALAAGPATAPDLAARLYATTPPSLLPAAARNVLAHLIDLADRALVAAPPTITATSAFALP